jgi:hypothetical protein
MGPSLKHAFDLLNVNRMQSGIDTYGQVSTCTWLDLASMGPSLKHVVDLLNVSRMQSGIDTFRQVHDG